MRASKPSRPWVWANASCLTGHVAPKLEGEELRKWWLSAPLSHFHEVRTKFDNAGVKLYAFTYAFRKGITDQEIERGFQAAQALGVKYITSSSNVSVAPRVDKYAQKYKIMVGFHGHDQTSDPDEFSTPETFARAMKGASAIHWRQPGHRPLRGRRR